MIGSHSRPVYEGLRTISEAPMGGQLSKTRACLGRKQRLKPLEGCRKLFWRGTTLMRVTQALLCDAISQRRSVSFWYGGGSRVADPYIVYENSTGKILVDAYQTSGYSERGESVKWKRFEVDLISSPRILDRTFSVRTNYNPTNRNRYLRIICKV